MERPQGGSTGSRTTRHARRRRRVLVSATSAALALALATAAQAQLGVDTELTPEPKPAGSPGPASQWTVLGGAEYGADGELVKFSETPATVDFFTTSFSPDYLGDAATGDLGNQEGFFGGAECIEETEPTDEALASCTRRPAIYRYYVDAVGDSQIEKVPTEELLGDPDNDNDDELKKQGFVGAIAWLDGERALAVGGTREYPRREPAAVTADEVRPGETYDEAYARKDAEQGAGMARAWIYDDDDGDGMDETEDSDGASHWRELDNLEDPAEGFTGEDGDGIPDGLRAMTALDCVPKDRTEFGDGSGAVIVPKGTCWAGGMQQLWRWRPAAAEGQVEGFDRGGPGVVTGPTGGGVFGIVTNAAQLPGFHFRVRQIRYPGPWVAAVTSGCCADPQLSPNGGASGVYGPGGARLLDAQDGSSWQARSLSPLTAEDARPRAGSLPDSYYGLLQVGEGRYSAIVSPGGGQSAETAEPGSRIVAMERGQLQQDVPAQHLDQIRLQAADGDFSATEPFYESLGGGPLVASGNADGILDWAVGRHKTSEQAIAYTTLPSVLPLPTPLTCALGAAAWESFASEEPPSGCDLEPKNLIDHRFDSSRRLVAFPTYALNALSFVPGTAGGLAWAAGDRGALVRLGGEGNLGAQDEPAAPQLRPGKAPTSDTSPFDPFRPAPADPGPVPSIAAQPLETLPEDQLVPYGTANAGWPTAIAMSRDGSEGWAVGDDLTLQRFDGERWAPCDPAGLGGAYAPDAACASLASLFKGSESPDLQAIARIPLEHDDDPTNDDEFEAIAIGGTVLGYSYGAGSWQVEPEMDLVAGGHQVAFTRPDDGWIVTEKPSPGDALIYHYGGQAWPDGSWVNCADPDGTGIKRPPAECGANVASIPRAGDLHVEVAGAKVFVAGTRSVGFNGIGARYPFVFSFDTLAAHPTWRAEYDPGCVDPSAPGGCSPDPETGDEAQGGPQSFSVADLGQGRVAGWMSGRFGSDGSRLMSSSDERTRPLAGPEHVLLRRDPDSAGEWDFREMDDAAEKFLPFGDISASPPQLVSFRGAAGEERSFIMPGKAFGSQVESPPLAYDAEANIWGVVRAPFVSSTSNPETTERATQGIIGVAAPDNRGGLWVTAATPGYATGLPRDLPGNAGAGAFYYRYTDQRHEDVFEDAANPVEAPISDLDGTSNGTVWVSTESDRLHRYDRLTGWETIRIPGWDRGRVVTRPSHTLAVAVNESGVGIAVGQEGRIANISPESVALDPASANRCTDTGGVPPCGTPRDLYAAEVAPDGAAMAGGEMATLTWRPPGGEFRSIEPPRISASARITDIAMPIPGRAWVTTLEGQIWAGIQCGESCWRWELESNVAAAEDERGDPALYALELDASGRGLAVGYRGAALERSSDGTWTRLKTGYLGNLFSVELPPSGYGEGDGVLIGGGLGVILTRSRGAFHVARSGDAFEPATTAINVGALGARIEGLNLAGGQAVGEVEAWAASQAVTSCCQRHTRNPAPFALLHYASDSYGLLEPTKRADPLADAPAPTPTELSLAAFGRSECWFGNCPPFLGTNHLNEVISRRINAELAARRERTGEALAVAFTGEINSSPGRDDERNLSSHTPSDANISHDQWREFAAEPLMDDGIAVFGAPGQMDLSGARACSGLGIYAAGGACPDPRDHAPAGTAAQWRETFTTMPAPWGTADPYSADDYLYRPVEGSLPKVEASSTTGEQSANTHYALDVVREEDDEPIARLVFADTSNARSLAASDANQNPLEPQEAWLEEVLCQEGSAADTAALDCTRPEGLPAVVVTTTPTYSYGPGGVDGTQVEAASFESLLLRHEVTALVTGHLGWNGLYYTCAPGLHTPSPGGEHPAGPPRSAAECAAGAPSQTGAPDPPDPQALASGTGATGLLPTVVASSAGGRFGPTGNDEGSAADGFWHGYSVIRIPADGDPSKVIVEQRPILDWIGITARDHVIGPRQRMTLEGFGREPLGTDTSVRMLEIDSHAITHRYDLLLADPDQPWMPCEETDTACATLHANLSKEEPTEQNPCAPYLCLPKRIGTVDETTGQMRAGNGRYPETFALGMLSVGSKAATYPIVFERSPSFVVRSALRTPGTPQLNNVPTPGAPGQQPPPEVPTIPKIEVPAIPPPPAIPSLTATAPPEPTPPTPPAPPPPSQQPAPLDLSVAPPGVSISTPTALIQPPTPPVNPAPPGGARKEARQRQAAAQKGGADSEESSETQNMGGDQANSPNGARGAEMTRLDHSFTRYAPSAESSPWGTGLLYGGGISLLALAMAFGWTHGRPTPRRREPELPAHAWARTTDRRR